MPSLHTKLTSQAPDLVTVLRRRAEADGDKLALQYLRRGEHLEDEASYAALDRAARTVAANLLQQGLSGRPLLIALPQGLDFVRCFLGCLYAGTIAIPAPPLGEPRSAERIANIADQARPAAVLAAADRIGSPSAQRVREASPATIFLVPQDVLAGKPAADIPQADPDAIAFLQYTSGSVSRPKGVVITRRNIAANIAMIEMGFDQNGSNSIVSWLPLHHDMGLIGSVLAALRLGMTATLMSPLAFLQKPVRWLRAIERFGATTAGAPNFGYDRCVDSVDAADVRKLDLMRWRLAFCGSEPVRADTLARFAGHFAAAGFDRRAFYPCYGLAEATLFVTGGTAGEGFRTETFPRSGGGTLTAVSCGFPRLGSAVALLDAQTGQKLDSEAVGEIAVAGDQVSPGFWDQSGTVSPDPSREIMIGGRRHLRTGDLGTMRNGMLCVVGRLKNMIIIRGMNIYAEDVEQTVLSHPAAAAFDAVMALGPMTFAGADGEPEGLAILCGLAHRSAPPEPGTLAEIGAMVAEAHGVMPSGLLLVPSRAIPRTVSGKLRRDAARARVLDNTLPVLEQLVPKRPADRRAAPRYRPAEIIDEERA